MSGMAAALWSEALKMRRSKTPWLSAFAILMAPLMGGLFMIILKDPAGARRFGIIAAKAEITAGTADWPSYLALLAQAAAIGGFFIFGLILVWAFGREYADRTAKDLLALPTAREAIVGAKFIVTAVWSLVLAALMLGAGVAVGHAVVLPGWSAALAWTTMGRIAVACLLTILLVWPFALAASAGRGYLPPFGLMIVALALAQVISILGWGAYFPWAVAGLYAMGGGANAAAPGAVSLVLVAITGIAGLVGTLAWWRHADQT